VDNTGEIIADRVQVHRVLQTGRERGHGLVGVRSSASALLLLARVGR
jgi:hypothetical protein